MPDCRNKTRIVSSQEFRAWSEWKRICYDKHILLHTTFKALSSANTSAWRMKAQLLSRILKLLIFPSESRIAGSACCQTRRFRMWKYAVLFLNVLNLFEISVFKKDSFQFDSWVGHLIDNMSVFYLLIIMAIYFFLVEMTNPQDLSFKISNKNIYRNIEQKKGTLWCSKQHIF